MEMVVGDVLFEVLGLVSGNEGCTGWEQMGAHLSTWKKRGRVRRSLVTLGTCGVEVGAWARGTHTHVRPSPSVW